jgi:hypothetical protein
MTSSRTREIVCGFLRFNFQGKTMDNEPDDIDEDDYEEDENDLGDCGNSRSHAVWVDNDQGHQFQFPKT